MKKSLFPFLLSFIFFSCNPQEELFKEANTIKFKMPTGDKIAIASVKNTYNTLVNIDTLTNTDNRPNKGEYLWDETDFNEDQVSDGLYQIIITLGTKEGTELASGAYVVGH